LSFRPVGGIPIYYLLFCTYGVVALILPYLKRSLKPVYGFGIPLRGGFFYIYAIFFVSSALALSMSLAY
jgi:hypothetical protein